MGKKNRYRIIITTHYAKIMLFSVQLKHIWAFF